MTLSSHTAPDVRPLLERLCLVHRLLLFSSWPMAKAEQRSPFAPAPLQGLRRYYGLLRSRQNGFSQPWADSNSLQSVPCATSAEAMAILPAACFELIHSSRRPSLICPRSLRNPTSFGLRSSVSPTVAITSAATCSGKFRLPTPTP